MNSPCEHPKAQKEKAHLQEIQQASGIPTLCCHIQRQFSITDEPLPAHDKSPPVCGISVAVHVGARPDPTASAPSATT